MASELGFFKGVLYFHKWGRPGKCWRVTWTEAGRLGHGFANLYWESIKENFACFAEEFKLLTWKQLGTIGSLSVGTCSSVGGFSSLMLGTDGYGLAMCESEHDSQSLPPHRGTWPRPQPPYEEEQLRKFPWVLLLTLHSRCGPEVLSFCIAPGICLSTTLTWSAVLLDDLFSFAFWSLPWKMSLIILHSAPSPT